MQTGDLQEEEFVIRYLGPDKDTVKEFSYSFDSIPGSSEGTNIPLSSTVNFNGKGSSCTGCANYYDKD